MGLLSRALDEGWTVTDGPRCGQQPGGRLSAQVDHCPCPRLERGCPVRLALDGDDAGHVMILDPEHRMVGLNRAAPGYEVDDVLGLVPYELATMAPEAGRAVRESLTRASERHYIDFFEFSHVRPSGERVIWVGIVYPLVGPEGAVEGYRLEMGLTAPPKRVSGVSWAPVRIAT